MILFIDRLPYLVGTNAAGEEVAVVVLPIIPMDLGRAAPAASRRPFHWRLDTGCTSDGFAFRTDLLEAGLDPGDHCVPSEVLSTSSGQPVSETKRRVNFWLVSNIPALGDHPYRIPTSPGVNLASFHTAPLGHFPIIGVHALRRAGLFVELDNERDTVSVWVPASPLQSLTHVIGRAVGRHRPAPVRWADRR